MRRGWVQKFYLNAGSAKVGVGLPAMTVWKATPIYLTPDDPTVGAGLPAKAAWQPKLLSVYISISAVTAT